VTGNTGFIGSRLQRRLNGTGVSVTGLSRSSGFDILEHELPMEDVDHVFHVAGRTYVPDAWLDPVSFYNVNAHGTVRVLDQCRRAGVSMTFVSAYVYGTPTQLPISEAMPARPTNPYTFSKLGGDDACRFFAEAYGVQTSVLRPFNVYGPGQNASFLIPTIVRQVLDPGVDEIVVADLAPRRDFVHVDDVIDALMLAPGFPAGATFNVGSGQSWSVGDIITTCLASAGVSKPFKGRGERRGKEILDTVADISAIERVCGWRPKTSIESGIRSVLRSVRP
jgi:nucleoside-diphosphate-sugar epimerase